MHVVLGLRQDINKLLNYHSIKLYGKHVLHVRITEEGTQRHICIMHIFYGIGMQSHRKYVSYVPSVLSDVILTYSTYFPHAFML